MSNFGAGVAQARSIGELDFDGELVAWIHPLRQVEVKRLPFPNAGQRVFERGGLLNGHAVATRLARDRGSPGRLRTRAAKRPELAGYDAAAPQFSQ